MYTVGIIGAGKIAGLFDSPGEMNSINTHARAVYSNPKLKLISVVDPNKETLKNFSRSWKVKNSFQSLDKFLQTKLPDIVCICSPNTTHYRIAAKLLTHNQPPKLLFIEKPVVVLPIELKRIIELEKRSKCRVVVNRKISLDPMHQKLSKIISSGILGKMLEGKFTYYGGWLNNGVHLMDLIFMLFGDRFNFDKSKLQEFGRKNDPCINTALNFNKFEVEVNSIDEKNYQLFEGEFRFTKGRVIYGDFGSKISVEGVVRNKTGEFVLDRNNSYDLHGLASPFEYSYERIVKYLDRNDKAFLAGISLNDIKPLMNKVFMLEKKVHN